MTTDITISEEDQSFGPAMLALAPNRRKFVLAVLLTGGRNGAEAARIAGYSEHSATATASQLMRDDKIIAAIREEAERRLKNSAALAVETLAQICADMMHKDRFKAACRILDYSGLAMKDEKTVHIEHTIVDRRDQLIAIRQRCASLGMDPLKVLHDAGLDYVDATFTEIFPTALPAPAVSEVDDDLSDIY